MKRERTAEIALLSVALFWGTTYAVTKEGLVSAPPLLFLALRFWLALLLLLPLAFRELRTLSRSTVATGTVLGLLLFAGYACQNLSLQYTSAGRTALFSYFFALIVPFLQLPFTGKRVTRGNIAGVAAVVAGLVLMNLPSNRGINRGDLLALGSALAYSVLIIFLDRGSRRGNIAAITFIQFLVTAVAAQLTSLLFEREAFLPSAPFWLTLVYLAAIGTVLCLLLMNRFQRDVTPVRAVIIYAMEPVFAVLFGILLLAERYTPAEWGGAALIVGGVIISDIWKREPRL